MRTPARPLLPGRDPRGGPVGEDIGWVMDFQEIKDAFAPLHDQLDHHYLNEVDGSRQPDEREPGPLDLGPAHRHAPALTGGRPGDLHLGMHLPGVTDLAI